MGFSSPPRRLNTVKVVPDLAHKGYCAIRKLWYYSMKRHLLSTDWLGRLPFSRHAQFTPAPINDLPLLRQQLPALRSVVVDKATGTHY